jgi:hypothetical protein
MVRRWRRRRAAECCAPGVQWVSSAGTATCAGGMLMFALMRVRMKGLSLCGRHELQMHVSNTHLQPWPMQIVWAPGSLARAGWVKRGLQGWGARKGACSLQVERRV